VASGRRTRILLVEDDGCIRETMQAILVEEGYEVSTAADGSQALAMLLSSSRPRPDLLIVDLMMPVLDGAGLCAEMARRPELRPLPVLVVSAQGAFEGRPPPLPRLRLLKKPIRFAALLDGIQEIQRPPG
jgi:CheY-like chemotaxis protein